MASYAQQKTMTTTTLFTAFSTGEGAPITMWTPGSVVPSPDVQAAVTELVVDHYGSPPIRLPAAPATAFMDKVGRLRVVAEAAVLEAACFPVAEAGALIELARRLPGLKRLDLVARGSASVVANPGRYLPLQDAIGGDVELLVGPTATANESSKPTPEALRLEMRLAATAKTLARCRAAEESGMSMVPAAKRARR